MEESLTIFKKIRDKLVTLMNRNLGDKRGLPSQDDFT